MSDNPTANLALPLILAAQAQKHVTHNEALQVLDTLVQLAVLDRDLTAPPGSPAEGQRWIVATSPTGAWAGHATHVAAWQDGAWQFSTPKTGWAAFVVDEGTLVVWNGSAWGDFFSTVTAIQNLARLGVGTTADATNPLSAKINNALFAAKTAAEGGDGDLRFKLSKESSSKMLSFLFQDNYSGRAEFGLTGDDDFHIKVSADGSSWAQAMIVDRTAGQVALSLGTASAPSLSFQGDLNTGLWSPGDDTIAWCTGGTEKMRITSGGDVGIGTNSPGQRLELSKVGAGVSLRMRGYAGTQDILAEISVERPAFNNGESVLRFHTHNGTSLAETMRIDNDGNLRLNAYGAGTLVTDASGNVTASSDITLKTDIRPFERGMADLIKAGRPIVHRWNAASGMDTARDYVGFSAQDYEIGVPEAIGSDMRGKRTFSDRTALAVHHNALLELDVRLARLESAVSGNSLW